MIPKLTREEHLKWCKDRAIAEYDFYNKSSGSGEATRNGMTSMMSDMAKHPETNKAATQSLCLMQLVAHPNMQRQQFVNFIQGFN